MWFRGSEGIYSKSLKSGVMAVEGRQTLNQVTRQTTLAICFYCLHKIHETNSATKGENLHSSLPEMSMCLSFL